MAFIPDDFLDEVRRATDIVDLISRYIPLRRSGGGYSAVCPFHEDTDPSLHVWPETQTWKCFGCAKGGNVFHFVMERERLTFPEAVRALAKDAGITLPETPGQPRPAPETERHREALEWACRFFESRLRAPEGGKVVEYLKGRGITGETAHAFRLGYAPAAWRTLLERALAHGFDLATLAATGLVRTKGPDSYDWFRDRLMFPIQDVQGRVIGFGGRILDDGEPKYLNSPDTALFKKGKTLYALNLARDEILKSRRLAIVEGYTDVLMAHQSGIRWFVAGLGTGLTREHANLVRRYADRVDLVYDGDAAGMKAADRALEAFLEVESDVRVVGLPAGADPCDFLVREGPDAFLARMEEGKEVFEFLIDRVAGRHDLDTLSGRIGAVDAVLSTVARTKNLVKKEMLLNRIADAFRVTEAAVRARVRIFDGRGGAVETAPTPVVTFHEDLRERLLIEAVLMSPDLVARLSDDWPPEQFRHPLYGLIATEVLKGNGDPTAVAGRIEDPAAGEALAGILSEGSSKSDRVDFTRQYDDCVRRLRTAKRVEEVEAELENAIERKDEEERRRLEVELFRLRNEPR